MESLVLHAVARFLLCIVFSAAALSVTARADAAADRAALAAISAANGGNWSNAYSEAEQSKDPLVSKVVRWLEYTRSNPGGRFAEISAFIDQNPDWPLRTTLRRRAEAAMASESDATAAEWLRRHPPISAMAKVRAAEIAINRGDAGIGTAALRKAWIEEDFSAADEAAIRARHDKTLRAQDHEARLDRLLWDGQTAAARRMLPLASAGQRALAEARLALAADSKNAKSLLAKVPAALRSDPGLDFEQARLHRKNSKFEEAARLLAAHPDNPRHPSAWQSERLMVIRRLMTRGQAELAYQVAQQHAISDDDDYAEAEFLRGYIALRFRNDPAAAFDHFAQIIGRTVNPDVKGRAVYWAGRAAAANGNPDLAAKWYAVGTEHMTTFYGQLSAHQLGQGAPPRPVPEPQPSHAERTRFEAQELVRAATLFLAAGDRARAANFLMASAAVSTMPVEFAMLASLAEAHGRVDLAIAVARRAMEAGMPLMVRGYPVTTLPDGGSAERSLVLAIVRQESAFAPDAQSPAGARGLMQLMPGTAKEVAGKLQLPYSVPRLTSDTLYNLTLGRSYIERMIEDFGGSYPLALAAYNAGPGRVRQWLREFGDPRGHDLSMVEWIEMIPFTETRIYVKRVLENLQIYRGQSRDNPAAFSLVADLAR
jgi:soluble lytic murein transglycosylase